MPAVALPVPGYASAPELLFQPVSLTQMSVLLPIDRIIFRHLFEVKQFWPVDTALEEHLTPFCYTCLATCSTHQGHPVGSMCLLVGHHCCARTQAVRNFVQLCLEGYYNGCIFHRVIKDYMAQTGDPTGTGTGMIGMQVGGQVSVSPISSNWAAFFNVTRYHRRTPLCTSTLQEFIWHLLRRPDWTESGLDENPCPLESLRNLCMQG